MAERLADRLIDLGPQWYILAPPERRIRDIRPIITEYLRSEGVGGAEGIIQGTEVLDSPETATPSNSMEETSEPKDPKGSRSYSTGTLDSPETETPSKSVEVTSEPKNPNGSRSYTDKELRYIGLASFIKELANAPVPKCARTEDARAGFEKQRLKIIARLQLDLNEIADDDPNKTE